MMTTTGFEPAYLRLQRTGELAERAGLADEHLAACDLCARACRVDRRETVRGAVCRTGARAVVSSFGPHHGEEAPLSGRRGSGTIFFGWCNLRCVFCQNWEISQRSAGDEVARRYSRCRDYVAVNRAAVREMHRQVGDLDCDEEGIARRGLLVRHLVLPNGLGGTEALVEFLAREISMNTYLNLMAQYHPAYRAGDHPKLARRPTSREYAEALALAVAAGLTRLDAERGLTIRAWER